MRKIGVILLQVGIIHSFLFMAGALKALLSIPLPTTIIGLLLLFLALQFKWIKLEWIEQGGHWLLANLLVFFVPSAVGIMEYDALLSLQGIWFVLIILISTVIVLAITGRLIQRYGEQQ